MNVYAYQAALLCEDCGKDIRSNLDKQRVSSWEDLDESCYDSDDYPKGPYSNGGGESDTPQHCDACNVFLENPLTTDGEEYVKTEAHDKGTPAVWLQFYSYLFEEYETPESN